MFSVYERNEFEAVMSESPYLIEELGEYWFGEGKLLFCSIEEDCTEEEEFGYDVIDSVLEGKPYREKVSSVGEECYRVYMLDTEDVSVLWDTPVFSPIREKTFGIVEVVVPGVVDYFIFY